MIHLALCFALMHSMAPCFTNVGDVAPAFEATDTKGQKVSLKALITKGPVVLVFFPKANTRICTQELKIFVRHASAFTAKGANIVAISADDKETLTTFRQTLGAPFTFLPDPQGQLLKLYNAKMPLLTMAKRKTYVVDTLGRIVFVADGEDAAGLKGISETLGRIQGK